MTQAEFAEVTGLGTATLVRWENGSMNHTRAYDRYIRLLESPEVMRRLRRLLNPVPHRPDPGSSPWRALKHNDRREEISFPLRVSEEKAA